MRFHAIAMLCCVASAATAQGTGSSPCGEPVAGRPRAFIAFATGAVRNPPPNGTVELAVCLLPARGGDAIASYRGELRFDSAATTVARIERGRGGLRIENGAKAGRVLFAGASPSGFSEPLVMRVALDPESGKLPPIRLVLHELSAVDGRDLSAAASVAGYPSDSQTTTVPVSRRPTSRAN